MHHINCLTDTLHQCAISYPYLSLRLVCLLLGIWVIILLGIFVLFHPALLHADEHVGDVERLLLQLGDDQALGGDLGLALLGSRRGFQKRIDSKREEERSGDDLENKLVC